ncbi:MAG: acetyl-CoA carboxylase biotin carboxyl carrier protein [Cytophagales bacterium]
MKPKEIQDLLEFIAQSGLEEVNIETQDVKITTKKSPTQVTAQMVAAPQMMQSAPQQSAHIPQQKEETSTPKPTAASEEAKYTVIKSPMIGTFYRSPGPNEDVFVNVGDSVNVGSTVCIIEAMKLFNEIESEYSGKIVKILVQDATPVEYDQPLFYIEA